MKVRLLGPMELLVGDAPVPLPGAAERALLAQLVLTPGRTLPATFLVDRLWPGSDLPVDPMNALQTRVSKLRRSLAAVGLERFVRRVGVGYRAELPPEAVDAVAFAERVKRAGARLAADDGAWSGAHLEAYDAALALWRGEPLADFAGQEWAIAEAARLTGLHRTAMTDRAKLALALGRHPEVVADLEPLVLADPTDEALAGLLMVALYRSGRQADALDAYTRIRTTLDEELGLEPSVSLRSLHERILRQDAELGAPEELAASVAVVRRSDHSPERTARAGALPRALRPLIGREADLDTVSALLDDARLVSLVGPGGGGKTSLALAAAVRAAAGLNDGAAVVRLAPVEDPRQVALAFADALGVPLDGAAAGDVRERVLAYLAERRTLLLVDNCEHVVDAVASLLDEILSRCPGVTVLATSREALAIPDEVQVPVAPLPAPPVETPPGRVMEYPAAQLFVERVRAVRPGTVLSGPDLDAVGRISRSLDGIPLALELAAARAATLSPAEIADRLTQRFALLTSGPRTAEARHQTLRATVDWSYALLDPHEQQTFDRLSVFQGAWTIAAAQAVVGGDGEHVGTVLDTVGRLVERSMVMVHPGTVTRYSLLETLRQYAAERLVAKGDQAAFARRHAHYYRRLVQGAERALRGPRQNETVRALTQEQPDVRAALAWFSAPEGDLDAALSMAGSLGLYWHLGRHLEGRDVLARLLGRPGGADSARARALQAVSLVERPRACIVHPGPVCAQAAATSLHVFDELGDASRAALSRVLLAVEGVTGADPDGSARLLAAAEDQFRQDGDAWGLAVVGFVRMETAIKTGQEAAAVRTGHATAAAFRDIDDRWGLSATLYHLGWGLRQFGRYAEGVRVLEEAVDVARAAGLFNTVQWALADLGVAHLQLGDSEAAQRAFGQARDASRHVGDGAGHVLGEYGDALLALTAGGPVAAAPHFRAAADGFDALATPVMRGAALLGLGWCAEALGEATAHHHYTVAIDLGRSAGEPGIVASALEGLARLAALDLDEQRATRFRAEATDLRRASARPLPPLELNAEQAGSAVAREVLRDER